MNRFKKKLRSQTGASITFALLLFLVCAVVGSAVLTAGTAAAGRMAKVAEYDQRYYAVTSAAELLHKLLEESEIQSVETYPLTTQNGTLTIGALESSVMSDPSDPAVTDFGLPGKLFKIITDTSTSAPEVFDWGITGNGTPGAANDYSKLDVWVNGRIQRLKEGDVLTGAVVTMNIKNSDLTKSDPDKETYIMSLVFTADINTSIDRNENQTKEYHTTRLSWKMSEMGDGVAAAFEGRTKPVRSGGG